MNDMTVLLKKAKMDATSIFKAALKAVAPDAAIKRICHRQGDKLTINGNNYDLTAFENIFLLGAGKATAPMAATMESLLEDHLTDGLITVKYGHTTPLSRVRTVEAGHPVPDTNGEEGSRRMLEIAGSAGSKDLCICLISGGGSALLPCPVTGVSLADKQEITRILLACGATIHETNTLRKHLSQIKGGHLAMSAAPATIVSLLLSDVVGDDLDIIASGPTVPDQSTFADCMRIVEKYAIADQLPAPVMAYFTKGINGEIPETPKPHFPVFEKTRNIVIGSNIEALLAAEKEAKKRNYKTLILSSLMEGETADVARLHAAIAKQVLKTGHPLQKPACILSGGETTVTLKGDGLGGRNQEFALSVVKDIAGLPPLVILSAGTDGNDGPTDAAGAMADNTTLDRALQNQLDINQFQAQNDAYHFFAPLDDLLITGPTNTNVMDLRIILIPD